MYKLQHKCTLIHHYQHIEVDSALIVFKKMHH